MRNHVPVLAWLHIVLNGFGVLGGLLMLVLFGGLGAAATAAGGNEAMPVAPIFGSIGVIVFLFIAILCLPGIVGGLGLLQGAGWARMVIIVISILDLFAFPVGTALGVYGLVVLFNPEVVAAFEQPGYRMR
jgi:hypothetical protein